MVCAIMAGGVYTQMAASQANSVPAAKQGPSVEDIINGLKPDPRCSELRAGGGDIQRVINNHNRIMADPVCRKKWASPQTSHSFPHSS